VFRQRDNDFLDILNSIRENKLEYGVLEKLNKRHAEAGNESEDDGITLCTTNAIADSKNINMLKRINAFEFVYEAEVIKIKETDNKWDNEYPADKIITLKKGARVMMLVNDREGRWVNGTIGVISKLSNDGITVEINNVSYDINRHVWETIDYVYDREKDELKKETTETFSQYPVMLAWAITIHKSQGKTFDKVIINLGGRAFAHGQTYVALSRCKTLNGIKLVRDVEPKDIIVDDMIVRFTREVKENCNI
jgi:hypothetical protein